MTTTRLRGQRFGDRLRYHRDVVKARIGAHPRLFYPSYRCFGPRWKRPRLVRPTTRLVIEGYPRSANSFAVQAFQLAQRREVRVAHHHHVEAQVLRGVEWDLPVCLLVRPPSDAVRSLLLRDPWIPADWALSRFLTFYYRLWPLADRCHVALFSEVVQDFGAVIRGINRKFGTDFAEFEHTDRNVAFVFERIGRAEAARGLTLREAARPDSRRSAMKKEIPLDECSPLLIEAQRLYERYAEISSIV